MSYQFFFLLPYFFMLIIGMVLPSDGSHGLLAPKSLAFIATTCVVGIHLLLRQKLNQRQLSLIAFFLISMSFLLIWFFIGIDQSAYGLSSSIDQLKLFILTITTVIYTLYIVSEGLTTPQTILRLLIISNFSYCLLKVGLVALHVFGALNMFTLLDYTGFRFMSMGIIGSISRLQTSVDIITPFLLLFVLQSDRLKLQFGPKFKLAFVIISFLSIFLSFSRFLIFVGLAAFILYWMSLNISRLIKLLLITMACAFFGIMVMGIDNVEQVIEQRFFSTANYYSDLTREEQISALMTEYDKAPLLGKGIGGYASRLIRDGLILHSYEVQWVAFLMQFGAIGIVLVISSFMIVVYRLLFPHVTRVRLGFACIFGLWMLSGFTNPFLISLTSGIVYSMFLLASDILRPQSTQNEL